MRGSLLSGGPSARRLSPPRVGPKTSRTVQPPPSKFDVRVLSLDSRGQDGITLPALSHQGLPGRVGHAVHTSPRYANAQPRHHHQFLPHHHAQFLPPSTAPPGSGGLAIMGARQSALAGSADGSRRLQRQLDDLQIEMMSVMARKDHEHAAELRAIEQTKAIELDELRHEIASGHTVCVGLEGQVQRLEATIFQQKRLSLLREHIYSHARNELKDELKAERNTHSETKRVSVTALHEAQEAEKRAIEAQHLAESDAIAAAYIQAIERGKRARAEAKVKRAEQKVKDVTKMAELSVAAAKTQNELEEKMLAAGGGKDANTRFKIMGKDGRERALREGLKLILQRIERVERSENGGDKSRRLGRFTGEGVGTLAVGRPEAAALGLAAYLKVDEFTLFEQLGQGVDAIASEFTQNGSVTDKECLQYVLHEEAGSSSTEFSNGVRDRGRNGERLADFVAHPNALRAGLKAAHVLALRLYTTAAFRSINGPLRDQKRKEAHPFSATVFFLTDGIRRLRTIAADEEKAAAKEEERAKEEGLSRLNTMMSSGAETDLWRGMSNMGATIEFEASGGSEMAPMSTTSDPSVAIAYGQSKEALLFKIVATSFMDRGADISFLSAFPEEVEYLYPPLTYLKPTGRKEVVDFRDGEVGEGFPAHTFTIIEVKAHM